MYQMAKSAREKLKAKARALAAPGTLAKGQDTTQASWSPAEALNADVKTGARPVGKARLYNKGGKVSGAAAKVRADRKPRKSGGSVEKEIGIGMSNRDVRAANEKREGIKHVGGFKRGGRTARATGGSVPSDKETQTSKDRVGTIQVKPKRAAAQHYKKGGKIRKADGGILDTIANALAGRGYIDGSTWMSKSEPMTASDSSAPASPRRSKDAGARRRAATEKMTPAQYSREMAMAYENEQPTIRGSAATPVQADRFMKKGGKIRKADGGSLPSPEEAIGSEERLKGLKVMPGKSSTPAAQVTPAQLRREEGYSAADMKASRAGRKAGGRAYRDMGGKIKEALGKVTGVKSEAQKLSEGLANVGKGSTASYSQEERAKLGSMAEGRKSGGRMQRASGGATLLSAMKGAARKAGKKGGKTNINIVINAGKAQPSDAAAKPPMDVSAPPPDMGMAPPPSPMGGAMGAPAAPPAPMGGIGSPAAAAILGRKSGGRITKVASSYKDMEAGAVSGEGRLQKTDIAKHHRDAPARKAGGRISKVAKSYKDMTAGAGDGEGRLQKTDIAKAKKDRAA